LSFQYDTRFPLESFWKWVCLPLILPLVFPCHCPWDLSLKSRDDHLRFSICQWNIFTISYYWSDFRMKYNIVQNEFLL
jgi:hypothetical protein